MNYPSPTVSAASRLTSPLESDQSEQLEPQGRLQPHRIEVEFTRELHSSDLSDGFDSEQTITKEPIEASQSPTQAKSGWGKEVEIFATTFVTIFLAELGDKTQLTTLLMSAESQSPWLVFAGAGLALVLTSLLGVWFGCWLAKRVSPRTLEVGAATLLMLAALLLLWDIWS